MRGGAAYRWAWAGGGAAPVEGQERPRFGAEGSGGAGGLDCPQGWREGIVEADGPLRRMVRRSGPEGQDAVWGPFQSEAWLVASSAVHEPSAGVSEGPV